MPGSFNIRVAVHTGKHAAVNGIFEMLRIDVQADRLAIDVVGQRSITVAGQAFIRRRFWRLLVSWLLPGELRDSYAKIG